MLAYICGSQSSPFAQIRILRDPVDSEHKRSQWLSGQCLNSDSTYEAVMRVPIDSQRGRLCMDFAQHVAFETLKTQKSSGWRSSCERGKLYLKQQINYLFF